MTLGKSKDKSGFFTRKDADGIWSWMGIVSNNWQDTHEEWITAQAHKEFAALIDSGEYGKMILASPFSAMQIFKDIGDGKLTQKDIITKAITRKIKLKGPKYLIHLNKMRSFSGADVK